MEHEPENEVATNSLGEAQETRDASPKERAANLVNLERDALACGAAREARGGFEQRLRLLHVRGEQMET